MHYFFYTFSCYPFINPIVNPADILPVNGIPKLVIANDEAVAAAAAWPSPLIPVSEPFTETSRFSIASKGPRQRSLS